MSGLGWLIERPAIVTLALVGAAIATLGSVLLRNAGDETQRQAAARARLVMRAGYAITCASIVLFIIAGFLSNR